MPCPTFPSFPAEAAASFDSRLIPGILQISLSSQSVSDTDLLADDNMMDQTLVAKITLVVVMMMLITVLMIRSVQPQLEKQ